VSAGEIKSLVSNDLYSYACKLQPELPKYIASIIDKTNPVVCQMSGSGPAIFAFYENVKNRDKALAILKDFTVLPMKTMDFGQEMHKLSTIDFEARLAKVEQKA